MVGKDERDNASERRSSLPESASASPSQTQPEVLPRKLRRRDALEALVAHHEMSLHAGPLPAPETFEGYERLLPGATERIFIRFEKQSDHRMDLESYTIKSDSRRANAGLVCATVVALAFLFVGYDLVRTGHDVAGAAIATADIGAILAAFIFGTRGRRAERVTKQEMLAKQEPPPPIEERQE